MRFSDKTILITGGTHGIGLAGAKRIISEGGTVIVTGLNDEHARQARQELSGAIIIKNDAADPRAGIALAETIKKQALRLDGLWLNAGYARLNSVESVDADSFDHMMHVNVRGPMLQLAALAHFLNPDASVLLTSSIAAYDGSAATPLYGATKGAVISLVRSWASELASRHIRVNTLVPGPIESGLRDFLPEAARKNFEKSVVNDVPLGRIGSADEAAAVALFLLSDDASYVTGSQYMVDGGFTRH
ncbi:MAG TPA: SDR family oxidoreductase [Candidatus Saccharimonadales bacterium]|nr:SDR family oxidoreductase [Candidatus Saccharimonadales bacterium]